MTAEEFGPKQAELIKDLPPEFQQVLCGIAWNRGHSGGYEEVINILRDLVYDFKGPIERFEKRLLEHNS